MLWKFNLVQWIQRSGSQQVKYQENLKIKVIYNVVCIDFEAEKLFDSKILVLCGLVYFGCRLLKDFF